MSSINFDNVWLLLLAVPVLALLAVPYCMAIRKDNRNGHNIASGAMHICIALLVAFAAAGTTIESVMTETHLYVLADVSFSTHDNLDVIDSYVENIQKDLPRNTKLGVVCFGKNAQRIAAPNGKSFHTVRDATQVDGSSTNIVNALDYTQRTCFVDNVKKRIVLITDGKSTDNALEVNDSAMQKNAEEALREKVKELNANGIRIDALYLDSNPSADRTEVQISSAEYSDVVYKDQTASISALVNSSTQTNANVTLSRDGQAIQTKSVILSKGATTVSFLLPTNESGQFSYTVSVDAEHDGNAFNNEYSFTQTVEGSVKVLLITGSNEDKKAAERIYNSSVASLDVYYNNPNVPYSVTDLVQYDEIILSNVDVSTLANYPMLIENLDTMVSLLGKSLVGVGNLYLQNTTDEYLLKLADMLPVRYGNSDRDPKLYTIVFDGSDSMMQAGKAALAKKAAKQLIDLLEEKDMLSIVSFYGDVEIKQPPVSVSDKETLKQTIDNLDFKQGTIMSGGLVAAQKLLQESNFTEKQILFIGDGLNSDTSAENTAFNNVVNQLKRSKIGISVIDVNPKPSMSEEIKVAQNRLQLLADEGKYWDLWDSNVITEDIFTQIADSFGETLYDGKPSFVYAKRRENALLSGVSVQDLESKYYISGAMNSRSKASAVTVLSAKYEGKEIPLYSTWNYGNGKSVSFTGSLGGAWMKPWLKDNFDVLFFQNVLSVNTPVRKNSAPFTVVVSEDKDVRSVEITPIVVKDEAAVQISLTDPEGKVTSIQTSFNSSVYNATFYLPATGQYKLSVNYIYKGANYVYERYVTQSFLAEYDSFAAYDASPLYRMLGGNGVVSETGKLDLEAGNGEVEMRTIDLTTPLMIVAILLFVADIIVRKLKWNDIKSLFQKIGKEERK